jgi:hypothetical protein
LNGEGLEEFVDRRSGRNRDALLTSALFTKVPLDLHPIANGEFVHGGLVVAVIALHGVSLGKVSVGG